MLMTIGSGAVVLVAVTQPAIGAGAAAGSFKVEGRWGFDTIVNGTTPSAVAGTAGTARANGVLDAATTVIDNSPINAKAAQVAGGGAGSLYFPGWKDSTPSNKVVDPTASSMRIPNRDGFNPLTTSNFQVEVWVRPDDGAANPDQGTAAEVSSAKIVAKGTNPPTNKGEGLWKVSMYNNPMRPICTFVGDTDPGASSTMELRQTAVPKKFAMKAGGNYRIRCDLVNGTARVSLAQRNADNSITDLYASPAAPAAGTYFNVANDDDVWVGKKQGGTEAGDSFAGAIDNLVIRRFTVQ